MMREEEESSIFRDVASSERDMKYFEEKKQRLGVFTIVSDLDQNHPTYTNSINHVKK
ncbi:MAG: hypothetical protein QXW67_03975 [Candidatus Micrarchaeia archaeon]